ncbi:response regulator [Pelosinus sp. sgz500959]|uniref:response regulator n=1 Tax=Pelosinus sp. sgz500959 TaxID=3242472 RepID=UPI003672E361
MSKIKILVVDDSPFIHKAITRALNTTENYEICGIAKNGKEGVELYMTLNPDLVTMDITMPIMDGLEASKSIIGQDPAAKIVMLSALGDEELINSAQLIGIKSFIQKPFKNDEFIAIIESAYRG